MKPNWHSQSIGAVAPSCREVVSIPKPLWLSQKEGADVSVDALGKPALISVGSRNRKTYQLGLMAAPKLKAPLPWEIITPELQLIGGHGMQAHINTLLATGNGSAQENESRKKLLKGRSLLEEKLGLTDLNNFRNTGVTVIRID